MNQILKKFGILLFAFAAVICLGVAAACVNEDSNGDKDTEVTVTLVSETSESKEFTVKPGDALPVVTVEDKDFEGYWTDSSYSARYTGTTVPSSDITLYYKLNSQYYTVIIDYGTDGSFTYENLCRGEDEGLPELSPAGTVLEGFAIEKGGEVVYPAGEPVRNLAEKDGTVTLYAVCETDDADDYVIENGVLVAYKGDATELTLPSGATTIAAGAFAENLDNKLITSVTVPSSYTKIECGAFEGLDNLQSLTVPFIGESRTKNRFLAYMFGAEKYEDNSYSFSLYSDGTNFYVGNENFDSLVIPKTLRTVHITEEVREFATGAFYSAYSLENVILDYPEKLMRVGNSAFENCYSFGRDTTLGVAVNPVWLSYVSYIGDYAFKSYTGDTETDVTTVSLENGGVGELVTYESPLNTLSYIPELTNIVTIGKEAFYYCAMIEHITFGENLKSVGDNAFMFAFTLSSLRFPDSLETIGKFAFSATGATVIEFGTGIREIGSMAFGESSSLRQVIFRGTNVPTLSGGQCFSNSVDEAVTGNWNIGFEDGFKIIVPENAIDKFTSAPDWTEYIKYIDGATDNAVDVYWSADGSDWDALFQFTTGGAVFVSDPMLTFITSVDETGTFSQACGTYYAMLCERVSAQDYAASAGAHARALYANEFAVKMWNPSLVDEKGNVVELYFVVTKLPFATESGRVLVPVLGSANAGATFGTDKVNGSFVISYNNYGIAQLMQVADGKATAVADPQGTYYSCVEASDISYTISYYNINFELISSRTFVSDSVNASDGVAPLIEKTAGTPVVITSPDYNDGTMLFLKGNGAAYIQYTDTAVRAYTADVTVSGSLKYGEEGYKVTFANFKDSDGASVASLSGSAEFFGFDGTDYSRIDLEIGDYFYMIVNVQSEEEWSVLAYNQLESAPKVIIPTGSNYEDAWRYKKLSNPTVLGSVQIFASENGMTYFREYDKDSSIVSFGTAQINGSEIKLVSDDASERTAVLSGNSLALDGKTFTKYNKAEDMTMVLYDASGTFRVYYYTVKTDGYGNMYIIDASGNYTVTYLGTYEPMEGTSISSMGYGLFVFTGYRVNSTTGQPQTGAEEETLWVLYDITSMTPRTSAQDSPWYTLSIGVYSPEEDTQITVNDVFGYKLYEITVDAFGGVTYVQFEYTLDREGNATYTTLEKGDVDYFAPVFDDDNNVALLVAVGADGQSMFTLKPAGDDSDNFKLVNEGGQMVGYAPADVSPDASSLEALPAGGVTFGTV